MSKAPYKLPSVFVGCPYRKPFDFRSFRKTVEHLPFRFTFADTHLQTKHLLELLSAYIDLADYCLFDISTWNPNVALEIGLAEGKGAEFYILKHTRQSKGVPADIQGIQRIEYSSYDDFDVERGLYQQLSKYLVRQQTHPRRIWDSLSGEKRNAMFTVALRILAHLRDSKRLTQDDITRLGRGSRLRKESMANVIAVLRDLDLISDPYRQSGGKLLKNLFRDPIAPRRA